MDGLFEEKAVYSHSMKLYATFKAEYIRYISGNAYREAMAFNGMEQKIRYLVYPILQQLFMR